MFSGRIYWKNIIFKNFSAKFSQTLTLADLHDFSNIKTKKEKKMKMKYFKNVRLENWVSRTHKMAFLRQILQIMVTQIYHMAL